MIDSLELKDFTCFSDSELHFCKGINVLIGKNGTGKTHIMKCMAATMKANKTFQSSTSQSKDKYGELLTDMLMSYFKPDVLGHLVNNNAKACSISLKINSDILRYNFSSSMKLVKTETSIIWIPPFMNGIDDDCGNCVFHVKQVNNGTSFLASEYELPDFCERFIPKVKNESPLNKFIELTGVCLN